MPELRELLGDAYKEGMTFDEASAALKDRKIVDLSNGEYVGKKKYDDAIAERDTARKEREEALAKQKDYDDLVKYRDENEAAKTSKALTEKLTGLGVKSDMVDFVKYQIESGKIERGKEDKDLDANVKKFLKDNPQYGSEKKPEPEHKGGNPRFRTGGNGDGDGDDNSGGDHRAKKVRSQKWNRPR